MILVIEAAFLHSAIRDSRF
jgi:hypothetical protein